MVIDSLVVDLWHSIFTISMMSYYGLETAGVDTVRLSDDTNEFVLGFILRDHHVRRGVVLLVAHEDVRDQATVAWLKCYGHFDGLAVPVL